MDTYGHTDMKLTIDAVFLDYPSHDQRSQKESETFTCNSFQPSKINFILKDSKIFQYF